MTTRRTRISRLRDALRRRRKRQKQGDDTPRTRISTPHWRRTHQVVSPERDLSEWVHQKMISDWDATKKGRWRG